MSVHTFLSYSTIQARLKALDGIATLPNFPANNATAPYCEYSDSSNTTPSYTTVGSKLISHFKVKGTNTPALGRKGVIITAGIHGDELAPPEAILTFIEKLLNAYAANPAEPPPIKQDSFVINNKKFMEWTIPSDDIKSIMEKLEVHFIPIVNPDGYDYSVTNLATQTFSRKNRNVVTTINGTQTIAGTGVDLNRNFDIVWDYENYYDPTLPRNKLDVNKDEIYTVNNVQTIGMNQSNFRGVTVASEIETQYMQQLIKSIDYKFFLDIHTDAKLLLYPWAIENNNDTGIDPTYNYKNFYYKDDRDLAQTAYFEYFPDHGAGAFVHLESKHRAIANSMRTAIRDAVGNEAKQFSDYPVHQAVKKINGSPGSIMDYAFDQQFDYVTGTTPNPVPPPANFTDRVLKTGQAKHNFPMFSFVFECSSDSSRTTTYPFDGGKVPDDQQFKKNEREIHAAIHSLLKQAAAWA